MDRITEISLILVYFWCHNRDVDLQFPLHMGHKSRANHSGHQLQARQGGWYVTSKPRRHTLNVCRCTGLLVVLASENTCSTLTSSFVGVWLNGHLLTARDEIVLMSRASSIHFRLGHVTIVCPGKNSSAIVLTVRFARMVTGVRMQYRS